MAERRIIEGTWDCGECGTQGIKGRHKECPQCGALRERQEASFDFGDTDTSGASSAASVSDAEGLELAGAGADWYCFYCSGANRGDGATCGVCGSERKELAEPPQRAPATVEEVQETGTGGAGSIALGGAAAVAVVALLVCLGGFAWWGMQTSDLEGRVAGVHWSRDIVQERFVRVTRDGWKSELREKAPKMPVGGQGAVGGVVDIRDCTHKERTPRKCVTKTKQVDCGTERKCERRDLGNGFAEEVCEDVTKRCDEEYEECTEAVFDDECRYDTFEWSHVRTEHAEGSDMEPRWPDAPTPGELDRLSRRQDFRVDVRYGPQSHSVRPETEAEFGRWSPGQEVVVVVNNLGAIKEVRPVE